MRLVNADKIDEVVKPWSEEMDNNCVTITDARKLILNTLNRMATVDAVEVVRCKDCKNRECVHDSVTGEIRNDVFFCKIVGYSSRFDFYCTDGERKDGDLSG